MKRRLAVVLMADMVDYTRLMEADQAGAIGLVRELRERWLEPEAARRGGEVVKRMGDGWIIAFGSVTDAVETARAVQTALAGHGRISLRVAAHLGEIAEDGHDLYGTGINVTARLQAEAPPGGVMISGDLYRQLDARLAEGFADAGAFALKNIAQPVTGYQWRPAAPGGKTVDDVPVIAVEPITASPGSDAAREAAADLQEQLVHRLSRRTGIRVVALDAEGAAAPTYLLRGRLRARGAAATVTLTLILHGDGRVLWSGEHEGPGDDLFALSDDVAEKADNELRLEINAFDGERLAALADEALSPSELRARAAALFYRGTVEAYAHATALMARALQLDPANAMSLAMWAEGRLFCGEARFETFAPGAVAGIASAADRAVQAASRSDYVFYVRAQVRARLLGDIDGARRDVQRLDRINPKYTLRHEAEGMTALAAGAWDDAAAALNRCVESSRNDPLLPLRLYALAAALLMAGRPGEAAGTIAEAIELRHDCRAYRLLLAEAEARAGNEAAATAARAAAGGLPDVPDILAPRLAVPEGARAFIAGLAPSGGAP